MRSVQSERLILRDGEEFCWCTSHQEYLPCEGFYIREKTGTGFDYKCKQCLKDLQKQNRAKTAIPKINEREIANDILTRLGYDLNSDIPVHEQLMKKYNDRIRT